MPNRVLLGIHLVLLSLSMLMNAFHVKPAGAIGTITINSDGSINPLTAPISTVDNITYVFTADINNQPISVQRNNITIDGRGHALQGSHINFSYGMSLSNVANVTVENMKIDAFWYGIFLDSGSNNAVSGNNITDNVDAIFLQSTANDSIFENNITNNHGWGVVFFDSIDEILFRNNITNNHDGGVVLGPSSNDYISENNVTNNTGDGIMLYGIYGQEFKSSTSGNIITHNNVKNNEGDGIKLIGSTNNTISSNNIIENQLAIEANYSSHNMIYNNNFVSNALQVLCNSSLNTWDNGYPLGGNYWNDYPGLDLGHDGIGDTEFVIDADNADNYPLMGMFSEFDWVSLAAPEQRIQTICNSTISNQIYNGTAISYDVTGEDGTAGFCRIRIPAVLLNDTYRVFVNGTEVTYRLLPFSNETYRYLYFNYTHSTQKVIIMPEFQSFLLVPFFMMGIVSVVMACKKKHSENHGTCYLQFLAFNVISTNSFRGSIPNLLARPDINDLSAKGLNFLYNQV